MFLFTNILLVAQGILCISTSATSYPTSVVELSVLRVVAGCLWSNALEDAHMLISVFLMLKVPHASSSAAEDKTFWIVLHSVCMGPVLLGLGFIELGEGQSL